MESKNIRVIDEHSIERSANVICAFDVDGSEYVTYWIERDTENDNVFVSKLLKNLDGTSNMVNIEDTMEKTKIADTVKELIKYSIDNESDKLTNKSIALPSGKNVLVVPVLINKDQNINVQKTYITTVKKSVTKVSDNYYEIKVEEKESAPAVTPVAPVEAEPVVAPVIEPVVQPVAQPTSVAPIPVAPAPEVVPAAPVVTPEPTVVPPVPEPATVVEPVVAPVLPVEPKVEAPVVSPVTAPVVETPTSAPEVTVTPVTTVVEPAPVTPTPVVSTPVTPAPEVVPAAPVVTPEPIVVPPVPEPATVAPVENKLVFDASKETNLNQALGEVANSTSIPVENIEPVREFGEDEPTASTTPSTSGATTSDAPATPPVSGGKMGFANSKFFMVVAIAFFLASCVFLGYEVFNYFQIKG